MKLDEEKIKQLRNNLSTPLSEISYILLAYALFTDGNVSEEENQAAIQITLDLGNDWNYEQEDIVSAYGEASEVCNGASKEELQAVFIDVLAKLDHQEDFKIAQRKKLIGYLESIMDADGVQHKNEIFYLDKIKELLKLEEDDSPEDISKKEEKVISPTPNHAQPTVYEIISKGIQNSKVLPYQPIIKEELDNKGFKNLPKHDPWFYIDKVSVNIAGNFQKGCLLVNLDGLYSNCVPDSPDNELKLIMPWDSIYNLQVNDNKEPFCEDYPDGLTELVLYTDENKNLEEAQCLSIIMMMKGSSKLKSPFSVIKSIYDNIWKKMIDKYRGKPILWGSHIDWFTDEVFATKDEFISFYTDEALEKLGTTKKDIAEKVLKNIAVSTKNPEAYAFVKAVSAKGAKMQDILTKYEGILDDHINFADEDGYTAMHYACWDNKLKILKMLIDFGANPNVLSPTNETPLNMAVVSGHFDIVQYFVNHDLEYELNIEWEKRNTDPNPMSPEKGSTLIRNAVLNQHWNIFDLLINGIAPNLNVLAEPCSVGFEGETNFFLAIEKLYQKKNIDYNKERLQAVRSVVEDSSNQETNNEERTVSDENRSALDRIVFFLLSFAHIADGEKLEKVEITKVRNIVKTLLQDTSSQADSLFKKAANWFMEEMTKVEWNVRDDSFQAILNKCITSVEDTFWKSKNPEKRLFINQVIGLANVDGTIGDGEIAWIERLCAGIDIEIPNILDADPERRWDSEEEDTDSDVVEDVTQELTEEMLNAGYTGKGTCSYGDGSKYVGDWKDGNMHGQGIYTWKNGDKHIGQFSDQDINGPGVLTQADGKISKGLWKKGLLVEVESNLQEKESSDVESSTDTSGKKQKTTKPAEKEAELKTENKSISKDASIWEIIQHEFINLDKESVVKKDFSEMILKKYPHIKKGTLSAQIAIQVINKRSRTNYNQCGKERVCGDNKFDFLFEQEDKTLCKYDQSKHGTWEIYKRDDGKLDVRSNEIMPTEKKLVDNWKDNLAQYGLTEESVLELFGPDLSDLADRQHGQVQIFDISPVDLKQCIKDKYVSASLKSIGKCRYGDWEALSLFLSEEEVSYEKREYEKLINELREECTNSGVDPAAQEFQPALVLLFCDGKYIFTGISRGPDL